ncbi:MAG: DUF5134 domain-containing protein [Pseudonocardiaceae bacterium]|nr:DUF5134 domain-containing protein [Pseudonocardiaceae bacterium]
MLIEWLGTVLLLAVAGHCVARLVAGSGAAPRDHCAQDRACDALHVLMSVGMAAMFSPVGGPIPRAGWEAVFCLAVGWSLVATVREREWRRRLAWARHTAAGVAMVYMLVAAALPMSGTDAGHTAGGHGGAPALPVLSWLLAGYFAGYALWSMLAVAGARPAAPALAVPAPAVPMLAPRMVSLCELVMAGGMAYMLLAHP